MFSLVGLQMSRSKSRAFGNKLKHPEQFEDQCYLTFRGANLLLADRDFSYEEKMQGPICVRMEGRNIYSFHPFLLNRSKISSIEYRIV